MSEKFKKPSMLKYFFVSVGVLLFNSVFSQACPPRPAAALKLINNDIEFGVPISVQNLSNSNGNDLYYIWDWGDGSKPDTLRNAASPSHTYLRPINDTCMQGICYTYTITLTAQNTSSNCLSHSSSLIVYIRKGVSNTSCPPRPTAAPRLVNNDICIGQPISVQNLSNANGNDLYYIWDWGDGSKPDTVQNARFPVHVYERPNSDMCPQPNGGYVYKLKLTAKNRDDGCLSDSATTDAFAYFSPIADFTAPKEVCIDNPEVTFTNTTCPLNTPGTRVFWQFGDPASGTADTSSQINPKHVFSAVGTYTVYLTATSYCNTSVKKFDITVLNAPIASGSFTLPTSIICAPYELTIANNSQNATGSTWSVTPSTGWEFTSGTNATSPNPVVRFNQHGEYTLSLKINSPCGTRDWVSNQKIVINSKPKVAMDTLIGNFLPFELTPKGYVLNNGGLPPQYAWTISGGSKTSANTLDPGSILFSTKGTFPINFKVSNACGVDSVTRFLEVKETVKVTFTDIKDKLCVSETAVQMRALPAGGVWSGNAISGNGVFDPSRAGAGSHKLTYTTSGDTKDTTIRVFSLPNTPAITGNLAFCAGGNTILTASGGNTYKWSTGATTPSVTITESGVFSVTLTDANGCQSTGNKTVSVNPIPIIQVTGIESFCTGKNTVLTATGGGTYKWSTGETTPSVSITQGGAYTVTVTGVNGCFATTTKAITVNPLPIVNITGDSIFCSNLTTILTATGGNNYKWSTGATTPNITISQAGTYTVTVTNTQSCSSVSSRTVKIVSNTLANITGNTAFCTGNSTTLTASGGTRYLWSNGSSNSAITVTQAGAYSVSITDNNGCTTVLSRNIIIDSPPNATISSDGLPIFCDGSFVVLMAKGGNTYLWSTGEVTSSISIRKAGDYTVTVTSSPGCSKVLSKSVTVSPKPTAKFTVGNVTGGNISLSNNSIGATNYKWDFGNGSISRDSNPTVKYNKNGTYTITLVAFTGAGCPDTFKLQVNITTVGIYDLPQDISVKISPNPFDDFINLKIEQTSNISKIQLNRVYIQDILGRVLIQNNINDSEINLNTSNLLQGTYIISVGNNERQFLLGKFMKIQ